ncbi:MAG: hypothetical protein ACFFHV_21890 [Promethearchaeota archaeon]
MPESEFYNIIDMENVKVSIPVSSHFTIGTSPYYAHQHGLAIDIYQNLDLENYEVLSPISGEVIKTKTLIAPKPKFNNGTNKDYLTLIRNSDNPEVVFKILHVNPRIQEGEKIEIGDFIGKTIRNGYFAYWSSPHLHLEIRPKNDAIRARGGKNFSLAIKDRHKIGHNKEIFHMEKIPVKIKAVYPEFILINFPENLYYCIGPIFGVKGNVNNFTCIVDGGIPIYKNGIVLFQNDYNPNFPKELFLNDNKIGTLWEFRGIFGFVRFDHVNFALNTKKIRGISLFLANFIPLIKIIPFNKNEFSFNLNSTQYLTIER